METASFVSRDDLTASSDLNKLLNNSNQTDITIPAGSKMRILLGPYCIDDNLFYQIEFSGKSWWIDDSNEALQQMD